MTARTGNATQAGKPRVVTMLAAGVLVAGVVCLCPRPARAVYECGGVQDTCNCGVSNFCICCEWSGLSGNCVWYAWHKACCHWGIGLQWCTDAHTWDGYAQQYNYPLHTAEPCVDSIFVCEQNTTYCASGGYGHVGWVTDTYADGSVDVLEQGCYGWDGVRSRHMDAQNASPAVKYIYKPGTNCTPCECNGADTEQEPCGDCGTRTRSCDGCNWGSWSACDGPDPGGGTQPCDTGQPGVCGQGIERCVDGWLECEQQAQPQAEVCGDGLDNDCDGATDEDCAQPPDGSTGGPDGAQPARDGSPPVNSDGRSPVESDGSTATPDGSGSPAGPGGRMVGGCDCSAAGAGPAGGPASLVFVMLAVFAAAFGVRRSRKRHG